MRRSYGVSYLELWGKILHLIIFAKKCQDITYKSKPQETAINESNGFYAELVQIGEEDQGYQTDKKNCCANFTSHQGSGENFSTAELDNGGSKLEAFLNKKQSQNRIKNRIPQTQACGKGKLGQLIGKRVQQFSEIGDHIILSGDFSIN